MALDTRDRRASALLVAVPMGRVLPLRDGLVSAEDFEQVAYSYRGIQVGPPIIIVPPLPPAEAVHRRHSRMTRLAHVQRPIMTGVDAFGMSLPPDWQTVTTTMPCWVWTLTRRLRTNRQRMVILEETRVLFPAGADVQEGDRVAAVTDRLGTVLWSGDFRVDTLMQRPDHLEGLLAKVD
jgi:hypothetical protein